MRTSDLGDYDALLAVATAGRAYAFLVPSSECKASTRARSTTCGAIRSNPRCATATGAARPLPRPTGSTSHRVRRVGCCCWSRSASSSSPWWSCCLSCAAAPGAGAPTRWLRPDESTPPTRWHWPPYRWISSTTCPGRMVVEVDNALRTSSNELALAIDEFGEERTAPFTQAVNNAKAALSQAFTVRQQLDDDTPETPVQRRDLLTRVIVSAANADRELESQTEAFEKLRDLVINAPSRLDATNPAIRRTHHPHRPDRAAVGRATQRIRCYGTNFGVRRMSRPPKSGWHSPTATSARRVIWPRKAVSGQQSGLVDAVRAAESALGQARALLDAVDSAASDIRHAVADPAVGNGRHSGRASSTPTSNCRRRRATSPRTPVN